MKTIIKIEKEDITTCRIGYNVEVQIDPQFSLVFSTEAMEELIKDYIEIRAEIDQSNSFIVDNLKAQIQHNPNQLEIPFEENDLYKTL